MVIGGGVVVIGDGGVVRLVELWGVEIQVQMWRNVFEL